MAKQQIPNLLLVGSIPTRRAKVEKTCVGSARILVPTTLMVDCLSGLGGGLQIPLGWFDPNIYLKKLYGVRKMWVRITHNCLLSSIE